MIPYCPHTYWKRRCYALMNHTRNTQFPIFLLGMAGNGILREHFRAVNRVVHVISPQV